VHNPSHVIPFWVRASDLIAATAAARQAIMKQKTMARAAGKSIKVGAGFLSLESRPVAPIWVHVIFDTLWENYRSHTLLIRIAN
jgi:hypothetical protein